MVESGAGNGPARSTWMLLLLSGVAVVGAVIAVLLVIADGRNDDAVRTTDDPGAEATEPGSDADREAITASMLESGAGLIEDDQAGCIADDVVGVLSDDGLATVSDDPDFEMTDLSGEDQQVMSDALDRCLDLADVAAEFSSGFADELGIELSDHETSCIADSFTGTYSGAGDFVAEFSQLDQDEIGASSIGFLSDCLSDETTISFMSEQLSDSGVDAATAECIATELVVRLGAKGVLEGTVDGSDELAGASSDAATACI